ncbi:MAG: hypothetical protein Q8J78_08305 [Moraxellaceae bacterium]|nr:hypothetical protein [Moraxellaceae bacterium]
MTRLYLVFITGNVLAPSSRGEAIAAFARLLSVTEEEARWRFDSAPCVVRPGLGQDTAGTYQRVLPRAGIECQVLRDPDLPQPRGWLIPELQSVSD